MGLGLCVAQARVCALSAIPTFVPCLLVHQVPVCVRHTISLYWWLCPPIDALHNHLRLQFVCCAQPVHLGVAVAWGCCFWSSLMHALTFTIPTIVPCLLVHQSGHSIIVRVTTPTTLVHMGLCAHHHQSDLAFCGFGYHHRTNTNFARRM